MRTLTLVCVLASYISEGEPNKLVHRPHCLLYLLCALNLETGFDG